MLKLLIDENLDHRIVRGLQLRIAVDYTLVQETVLAGQKTPRFWNGQPGMHTCS